MTLLILVEPDNGQPEKHLEQVKIVSNKIEIFIKEDTDNQLFQYIISRQKEIFGLFEKGCLIIQAYNNNNNIKF